MAAPSSSLQAVQTYQQSGLAYLQNLNCAVATANTKFKEFNKMQCQLGSTVTFDRPIRYNYNNSLTASFQGSTQLVESLTVNQEGSVAFSFNNQDYIFNADKYVEQFHRSATHELSANIEANIFESTITQSTYRTYYAGISGTSTKVVDAINSRTQIATALANFRNFGAANGDCKLYIPDMAEPAIVGQDLSQFAPIRNDREANSWELGNYNNCDIFKSNLLPLHTAGTVGNEGETMTVVSLSADGTTLSISGVTPTTATLAVGDILEFNDGVSGQPNVRFLTYTGHKTSAQKVQVRVTQAVTADGSGNMSFTISPALISDPTNPNRNVSVAIAADMQLKALPNHRAGLIVGGDALYLAMPQLAKEDPFPTSNESDPDTSVSMRVYYGSKFGENERGFVVDAIWGSHLVQDYAMRVAFPETV